MKRLMKVDVGDVRFSYEAQTDVLYVDFGETSEEAEETILLGDQVILRVKGDRLLGITVMEFTRLIGSDLSIREF